MDTNTAVEKEQPPRIHLAFVKGFNTLANNAYLLLVPLLLDIFFWLGPKFSIGNTLNTFFNTNMALMEKGFQQQISQPGVAEQLEQLKQLQPIFQEMAESFNLFGFLNTSPIGVPSLLAFTSVIDNPFGFIQKWVAASPSQEFLVFLGLLVIGSFLGGLYFSEIGRRTNQNEDFRHFSFQRLVTDVGWMMMINFTIWIIFLIIVLPLSFIVIMLVSLLNAPNIIYSMFFVILLVLFWIFIPLVFTPHGIIIQRQNPVKAMLSSIRLIRYYMPGTGFFIMLSLLLYQVMNQFLWLLPKSSSYMLFGGIFGHAFICTGLLSSSYMYYQDGIRWMNHNLKMLAKQSNQTSRPFQA